MASSTPTPSPRRREQPNPHPYPVKTSSSGLLTRSNTSKAHGSWARHKYTPVPPSPSAFVFDPPESTPSPSRQHAKSSKDAAPVHASPSNVSKRYDSPQRSEKTESMSPSPSKYSKTWIGRNSEGEQVKLPRHPYIWTPTHLAAYLSSELYGSDGEPLDSEVIQNIITFIEEQKIGGRAFLSLDQEDFQEMEGLDDTWSNALWDASCTLRQAVAPYRPSRISSSSYKRGRVRGIVNVFERSASESSDVGEDDASSERVLPPGSTTGKFRRQTQNVGRSISGSEDESFKLDWDSGRHAHSRPNSATRGVAEASLEKDLSISNAQPLPIRGPMYGTAHSIDSTPNGQPVAHDISGAIREDSMTAITPHPSDAPIDIVLGQEESQDRSAHFSASDLPDDNALNDREVEIVSSHTRKDSEPTMAELYEQTYGTQAPSPHDENLDPLITRDLSDDEMLAGETVKIYATPLPNQDRPPIALRPIMQHKASTPPPSLTQLFVSSPVPKQADMVEPQDVYVLPVRDSETDEAAQRTLDALKLRLEVVERRLEAMEKKDIEPRRPRDIDDDVFVVGEGVISGLDTNKPSSGHDEGIWSHEETLRTWQSAYILLAGATTGISVVLIPMLLRHFWTK